MGRALVKIRDFTPSDLERLQFIHESNGLPSNCFPDTTDPLFIVKQVVDDDGRPVMGGFISLTAEAYLVVDHTAGTPDQRWQWLQQLTKVVSDKAYLRGLNALTVWIPPELLDSFEKRLLDLGFRRSPWQSFTLPLGAPSDLGDKVLEVSSGSGDKSQA